uniref:Uncharacterized protein n=1 Tax=Timema shepardi TaxID=629360 RepID=A0A7R9G1W1_TIMSH|nr:unnamed protein product [Timema shepardi]
MRRESGKPFGGNFLSSRGNLELFCAKQELPLCGHRDFGYLSPEEPTANDGNFRALLRYRASHGDNVLADYILPSAGNAIVSAKRAKALKDILEAAGKGNTVFHKYCETRWVERHDAVSVFHECFDWIIEALDTIMSNETEANGKYTSLYTCL